MNVKTHRTRAIVLRRTNYGEADRILDLLTPDGRLSVMARGVRKEKSKLAGGIELFAVCDVFVGQGKGQLGVLMSARIAMFYRHILKDYDRTQFAYEMLAQISKMSSNLDEAEWYEMAAEILAALDVESVPLALVQTWFYVRVSILLGEELSLTRDASGGRLVADKRYRYDSAERAFVEDAHGSITSEHIKILRLAGVKSLSVILQIGGIEQYLPECLDVARRHAALENVLK